MFNQANIEELKEIISKATSIGIVVKENPTIDTMAAGLALYLSLRLSSKNVSICCKSEPVVEISSLVGIDKVQKELEGAGRDLTISLPYKQGTIEKISYNIDGDRINLVVKGGEDGVNFDPSEVRFLKEGGLVDVIFCVGIKSLPEIKSLINIDESQTFMVAIDNDPSNERFGRISFVDPSASSISELVTQLLQTLNLPIDVDTSQNLLSGIDFATDSFQDPRTSPLAFEVMAGLLRNGAKRSNGLGKRANLPSQDLFAPDLKSIVPDSFADEDQRRSPILKREEKGKKRPPSDWLAPKIYKGSTTV